MREFFKSDKKKREEAKRKKKEEKRNRRLERKEPSLSDSQGVPPASEPPAL